MTDEQQIINLCHTYPELLDAGNHEGLGQLFRDGEIRCYAGNLPTSGPHVGASGVKAFYDSVVMMHDGQPRTRHVIANLILHIDPGGETASSRSYFQVVQDAPGCPLQIIASGRYHDEYRKRDGEWRFVRKVIWADYLGNVSAHARPQ